MPNKDKIMNNEERKITNKYNNKSQEFETNKRMHRILK